MINDINEETLDMFGECYPCLWLGGLFDDLVNGMTSEPRSRWVFMHGLGTL